MLVFELTIKGERRLPWGVAFKEFNGQPAVILHLQNFSLWVTSSYTAGATALPCVSQAEAEELNLNYA